MKDGEGQAAWQKVGLAKKSAVRQIFAEIAPTYDRVNSVMSFNRHKAWRRRAVREAQIDQGDRVLDLCCGTGDFLEPIAKAVGEKGQAVGADFCLPMLKIAQTKGATQSFAMADATTLPFKSCSFDVVTVGWGLRNVPDLDSTLAEVSRVLKGGGRLVSVDMARSRTPVIGGISEKLYQLSVPVIGKLVGHEEAYKYLPKSTEKFASREQLAQKFRDHGFVDLKSSDFFFGNIHMILGVKK